MSDNATAPQDQTMTALQRVGVIAFALATPGMGHVTADMHGFTADDLDAIREAYPDATVREHPNGQNGPFRVVKVPAGEGTVNAFGPPAAAVEPTTFADHLAENASTFAQVTP